MVTMKQWEDSAADKKVDKKLGYKEGSKQDTAADKAAITILNMKIGPFRPGDSGPKGDQEAERPDPQRLNSSRDRVTPQGGFAGSRQPHTFGHETSQCRGKLRCSGHSGAHQIGKKK